MLKIRRILKSLYKLTKRYIIRLSLLINRNTKIVNFSDCDIKKIKIYNHGKNNRVVIENQCCIKNTRIIFNGDNNVLHISSSSSIIDSVFVFNNNNGKVFIGKNVWMLKDSFIVGKHIEINIEDDCLFGADVELWSDDGHTVKDLSNNKYNAPQNITINKHVWIGTHVMILKGSVVGESSVVGACSVVCGIFDSKNCLIAGNPASIRKNNIEWER